MSRWFRYMLASLMLASSPLQAKDETALKPVYVDEASEGGAVPLRGFDPGSVRVFERRDFEGRAVNLATWISRESGLHLSQLGDEAAPSTVSIRGSTSDQVAIYLNGVRLNPTAGGGVNLSQLSLDSVKRISVYKGRTPLSVGGDPVGGTIFIETESPKTAGRTGTAKIEGGSFGTVSGFLSYGEMRDHFSLSTNYNTFSTQGDFAFSNDNGTPANLNDDYRARRENNESIQHDWQVNAVWTPAPDQRIFFYHRLFREDRGIPGKGAFQADDTRLSDTQSLSAAGWQKTELFPKTDYSQRHSFVWEKSQFADPNAELGLGGPQDTDDDSFHYTHEEALAIHPFSHLDIRTLFAYEWEQFNPESLENGEDKGPPSLRHRFQWGSEFETELWNERLFLVGSGSYIEIRNALNDRDPSSATPSAFQNTAAEHLGSGSGRAELALFKDWLWIEGEAIRGVRPPHFFELFGDRGALIGNSQLKSEKSWTFSGGLRGAHAFSKGPLDDFFLSVGYFDRRTEDLIQFQELNGAAQAQNMGKSHAHGLELESEWRFLKRLEWETSFTYQEVKDREVDRFIPGNPRFSAFSEIRLTQPLGPGTLALFGNIDYNDERYLDRQNTRLVVHEQKIGAGASYAFLKHYRVFMEARNLSGEQVVDIVGYPLPGRAFYGGLEWEFSSLLPQTQTPH